MSKYKLMVSDTVVVPVRGSIADSSGQPVDFDFTITCKRVDATAQKAAFATQSAAEFLGQQAIAWAGQKLVIDEFGNPAEFCQEALSALFDIQGMDILCVAAYVKAVSAREKN